MTGEDLANSISQQASDYRSGQIAPLNPEHVLRWASQFDREVRTPLLQELDHVLRSTYFSRDRTLGLLRSLVLSEAIAGTNPCAFWSNVNFLDCQMRGHSQKKMLQLFDTVLVEECGLRVTNCGGGPVFLYLDDGLYTGSHVRHDLASWIVNDAPNTARLMIITTVTHTGGRYFVEQKLTEIVNSTGKSIDIQFLAALKVENRKFYRSNAAVLWPTQADGSATEFLDSLEETNPFFPRAPNGLPDPNIYSSEAGRQLLENEMLKAGMVIRSRYDALPVYFRPLGFGNFGLGFGAMTLTNDNCPNNCPLALWWGDLDIWPPRHWYPLFKRRENE